MALLYCILISFYNPNIEKMGAKRPFQEDNFPELSFKQVKQFGFNKNLKSYVEDFPSHVTSPKSDFNGVRDRQGVRDEYTLIMGSKQQY
ncbi:Hypothetical predicted protein [Olea europaea subsp. europaea]|uniref:Uncharacterized protein n=1 Tax=Olea europaea subsp. europaea TaxID=158383 RepID=A0A8S0T0Q2_OLEEU|nr:Hypothetical predicted protein [Olea europaea subsp. europaea]